MSYNNFCQRMFQQQAAKIRRRTALLFVAVCLLCVATPSYAAEKFCSDYTYDPVADQYIIDGDVLGIAPTQITIDYTCTFQNWTNLSTHINFQTNDPSIYLIIFDNVDDYTGNMACSNIEHKLWVVNTPLEAFDGVGCQDIIIPPETINKAAPVSTVGIGEQFTYRLTLPYMLFPEGSPSPNDIGDVVLTDDLSAVAMGAEVTLIGTPVVTYAGTGTTPLYTFSQVGDLLTFEFANTLLSGQQVYIDITVQVDDDPANTAGTVINNTAEWAFSRWVDLDENGIFEDGTVDADGDGLIEDEFFNPLPGESGRAAAITIGEPSLTVNKSADQTGVSLLTVTTFTLDVENVGGADAWDITLRDLLPDASPGPAGLCDTDPSASITAEVFESDGVTTVSGPLVLNTDFTVNYDNSVPPPVCQFTVTTISDRAVIGPGEHLIITHQTQLDSDTTADGESLTNIVGAEAWYSADSAASVTRQFTKTITDGTPGVIDFQDSYTLTTALSGYYFEKTATNLATGEYPAVTATLGDTIEYTLRLFNFDDDISNIEVTDTLDPTRFDLSSFSALTVYVGGVDNTALYSSTFDSVTGDLVINGGSNSIDVASGDELSITFEIDLLTTLSNGDLVDNQADLIADPVASNPGVDFQAISDDPFINGVSDPTDPNDQDQTRFTVQTPGPLVKVNNQTTAAIGEQFTYTLTIPATPINIPLYDVRIVDDFTASAADIAFVSATDLSGNGFVPVNTGTTTNAVIEDLSTGIDIAAGEQVDFQITAVLLNTATNQLALAFNNTATYTYNRINNLNSTQVNGGSDTSNNMTIVEPRLTIAKTVSFVSPAGKAPTDTATVGDVLAYQVTLSNTGNATAYDVSVTDALPTSVTYLSGSASAEINNIAVAGFVDNPDILATGEHIWGDLNEDSSLDIPVGQSLVLTYQVRVDDALSGDILNSVVAEWSSQDNDNANERDGLDCPANTTLDDYCVGPVSVSVDSGDDTAIEKQVIADSYNESPASTGNPVLRVGDTVTYELTLNLQEYTTEAVVVNDVLPAGMAYDSLVSTAPASGVGDFTYTLNTQPSSGDTGTLIWDLGDVLNAPSGDGTPVDPLVIQYRARVVTNPAPTGISETATTTLTNRASLNYTGGDAATDPTRLTATAAIDVLQPQMSVITKADVAGGRIGTGSSFDPYQVDVVNDRMNFEVQSCNNGLAPAYGTIIRDQLPLELNENDLLTTPPTVTVGPTILTQGVDYNLTVPARGGTLEIALQDSAPIAPGDCVTVNYRIGFYNDIAPFSTWNNTATLAEYRSRPLTLSGRVYTPSDVARVYMTNQFGIARLSKTLISGDQATIGEQVVYEILVPATTVNAALDNVVVTDTLNSALAYESATAVDLDGNPVTLTDNSVAPDQINLGIAQIAAGQQVLITLTTRVQNNAAANAGVSFTNTAAYDYTGLDPAADTSGTSAELTLVEPTIAIAKTVANVTTPGAAPVAGEVLRYTLTFTASGGASDDNYGDAFDLQIDDSLGLGLLYIPGTATVNGGGNTITDPADNGGDGINTSQSLSWGLADASADIDVVEGTVVTVTYDVQILSGVAAGQDLINSANVRWTSLDGASVDERDGSNSPALNDYFAGPATTTVTTRLEVNLLKSVVNDTSGQDPGTAAEPGDTLRYTLVLTNDSVVPITNGVFTDTLSSAFAAGTLQLMTYPNSADIGNTDASGGANGTGLVDIRNLTLAANGNAGDSITLEFTVQLTAVIDSGTVVANTGQLVGDNLPATPSNTTSTTITSAPLMQVQKTSSDLTDDPDILLPGDILRYTISVKNIGNENAVDVSLRDIIPTYTRYVANSTTLNGNSVADPATGVSALQDGMLIYAPEDSTPGVMRADVAATANNVATVTFDVTVDRGVIGGTAISNQGYVNGSGAGASGEFTETPSDDPNTEVPGDPTVDVVGNRPLLDAYKTVQLQVDNGSAGVVDPGDVLRYTIYVVNQGVVDATGVTLVDAVPVNSSYVADTTYLNDMPINQPDAGVSPLAGGIAIYSDDGAEPGVISAGGSATIRFDVMVDVTATTGTIISNQGVISSIEQDDEPTDADGIDSNGDQPTLSVVGPAQLVTIIKEVFDLNGGVVLAGDELEYVVTLKNAGSLAATDVILNDDLDQPEPNQLHYVMDSATFNGANTGVTFSDPLISADYGNAYGDLAPGMTAVLRFRAYVDDNLAIGTTVINTAQVYWNAMNQTDTATVSVVLGAPPTYTANLGGTVWHDTSNDRIIDGNETRFENWTVELLRNNTPIADTTTDEDGHYNFFGLPPNDMSTTRYGIRFAAPGAGLNTASLGMGDSPFTNGPQSIDQIIAAGNTVMDYMNLPLLPNGVVYDSISRVPVPGATLTLADASSLIALPDNCFDDPAQQGQITLGNGFYRFDINFSDPACQTSDTFLIQVTEPSTNYEPGVSRLVPPQSDETTAAFDVPACLNSIDDALPATPTICEVVSLATAPPAAIAWRDPGTHYYLHVSLNNLSVPDQSQLFNNHIALDPTLDTAVSISKVAGKVNVSRGDLVPYTITIQNAYLSALQDLTLVDMFPPGFKYIEGSARLNGTPTEPLLQGPELRWENIDLEVDATSTLELLLTPGSGVSEGEYVNRAQVRLAFTGDAVSNVASASVRVVPDPTLDCSDIYGKVFEDSNINGYPDKGEAGIAGARVVSARGLMVTTDQHGRFHITCAAIPNEMRGSNFILKLDDRSLPSGYRVTTENPRIMRLTRGKAVKFNFGTTLHRIIRLDIAEGIFQPGSTTIRPQWLPRFNILMAELQKSASIVRISYLADVEKSSLVADRVATLKKIITDRWDELDCCYKLEVETEIFWRRGSPPDHSGVLK